MEFCQKLLDNLDIRSRIRTRIDGKIVHTTPGRMVIKEILPVEVPSKLWNKTLKNIKNETLIVWGDQDKSYNLEQIQTLENNIENCKLCGKCKIKDIIEITSLYGIHAAIATGGTMARKLIKDHRPKFIIAVACERDLASGIQDAFPLPVYGITNKRPFGPCFNTDINIKKLKGYL